VLAEQHEAGALPTTVQGLIAARVDRLSESAREVARVASIIGRTFPYRVLVAASATDVERGLEELLRQSMVRERVAASAATPSHTRSSRRPYTRGSWCERGASSMPVWPPRWS